ncbi:MAG: sulfite exporter TauE/SafE family protein [Candidatus Thermoplasmatota archaeon]|nr:sulfite exporter TauE/SafE family protein [Candidatus Thermoplasmatota archaeon]
MAGLGGGVLIVPFLTLYFHVPISLAIGASIISVIATSSGSASAYVKDKISNIRVGTFLVLFTTSGAILGAFLEHIAPTRIIYLVFGIVLLISVMPLLKKFGEVNQPSSVKNDPIAERLSLSSHYHNMELGEEVTYNVAGVKSGSAMMLVAGILSGLLGIGSGVFKVIAMDTFMKLPIKVSTTTSNFMIGMTAAASAGIYFFNGYVNPYIAAPVAIGVLIGAVVGARLLVRTKGSTVRLVFAIIIVVVAVEMLLNGVGIRL